MGNRIGFIFLGIIALSLTACSGGGGSGVSTPEPEKNYYTVTWKNYDNTILEVDNNVLEGTIPSYDGQIPTKPGDAQYSYTFTGWSPYISAVVADVTYVAQFSDSINGYTVTWKNYDGTVLEIDTNVPYGSMPSYDGQTPVKNDTEQYSYTFDSWSPSLVPVTDNVTYESTFSSTLIKAKVIFNLDDGTSPSYVEYKYLDTITAESFFFDVTKKGYNFRGWSYKGVKVFDNKGNKLSDPLISETMVFTALFAQTAELNIVKSIDAAGTVTGSGEYEYNSYVDVTATPFTGYVFDGWYYQDTLLSKQNNYKYMMWNDDVTLEARFMLDSYLLEVHSYNTNLGLVMIKDVSNEYTDYSYQRYDYTTDVTIAAYTKTSENRFLGWFDTNGELVETNAVYSFAMPNRNYKLIAKWDLFTLDLNKNIEGAGVLTGAGNYKSGEEVTITATANKGYTFVGWYDTNNNLVTSNSTMTMSMLTEDLSFVARFIVNDYNLNVTSEDDEKGTVTGSGTYAYGSSVTVKAIANSGYTFEGWYEGTDKVSSDLSYTFVMPYNNVSYVAKFTTNSYTVTASSESASKGTVIGSGTYLYKSSVTIVATASAGYTFEGWYNGSNKVSSDFSYTFIMPYNDVSYVAKFSTNSYQLNVTSEDDEKGTITGSGTYAYGSSVTIKATANSGYTFEGWYEGTDKVSSDSSYTFTMPYNNVSYVAKFTTNSYTVTTSSESTTKGTVIGSGTYLYKSSVTIVATASAGYTFEGWYEGTDKVSSDSSYTFTMPYNNVRYVAKFSTNSYQLNVTSEDYEKGTVTGSGTYAYGSNVTVKATANTTDSYATTKLEFIGWYDGDTCVSTNTSYTFSMPAHDLNLVAKFGDIVSKTTGDTILFGSYPQTKVTDSTTISDLTSKVGTLPSKSNSQSWTPYNWYISSSNATKFAWYIDLDINEDGQNDYRGVYFTSYRPYLTSFSSSSEQYDNGYSISTLYFFKYEPIEWRILSSSSGDYFIMSNKIIDCEQYNYQSSDGTTRSRKDYQGNNEVDIYDNNYQYSDLRTFLNTSFYNSAFNSTEACRIQTTAVDNSESTIGSSTNKYVCGTTNDKVFALSRVDVKNTSYGFTSDTARQLKVTDYVACMGCKIYRSSGSSYDGCGDWWLRSPSYNISNGVWFVEDDGYVDYSNSVHYANCGVVPALHLQ